MVSCQKGPTRHAYALQIGPFWQDTLDIRGMWLIHSHKHHKNNQVQSPKHPGILQRAEDGNILWRCIIAGTSVWFI